MVLSSGNPLVEFADFVASTGPAYVKGPSVVTFDAAQYRTHIHSQLYTMSEVEAKHIRGGSSIKHNTKFKPGGTFETYLPGQAHQWTNPQGLRTLEAHYRYWMVHFSYVEQELLLNEGVTQGGEARFQQYVKLRDSKMQTALGDLVDGQEGRFWAVPNKDTMESSDGQEPYSIWCFINEDTNGLFGTNWTGNTWTTVEGINPAAANVYGQFAPQVSTYTQTGAQTDGNIFSAFDTMRKLVCWKMPTKFGEYWTDDYLSNLVIVTSMRGQSIAQGLLRNAQDQLIGGRQDPAYPDPTYHGIPIRWSDGMTNSAVYDTGSNTLGNEFNAANDGPRFLWINGHDIYPVYHSAKMGQMEAPLKHPNVPDTWTTPIPVWGNLFCESRKRSGIVRPQGSIYTS